MKNITEMLKGVLEGCILEIISNGSTYGYEITQQLRKLGFDEVVEGTVYTILVRLEKNDLVSSHRQPSAVGPPRKFYRLTELGQDEVRHFWVKWNFITSKLNQLRSS